MVSVEYKPVGQDKFGPAAKTLSAPKNV